MKFLLDDQRSLELVHRPHARARRITLRFERRTRTLVLTRPSAMNEQQALHFARKQEGWIKARLNEQPALKSLEEGAILLLMGKPHKLVFEQQALRSFHKDERVHIVGNRAKFSLHCLHYLRRLAAEDMKARVQDKSALIQKKVSKITIRDQRTRWGSCSSTGNLSFSWRIIMAPDFVRDYLAAHEVAHLVQMNHSDKFWALSDSLTQGQLEGRKKAEAWLRQNAKELQAVQV